jgi:predicted nucleic acid-binding protein
VGRGIEGFVADVTQYRRVTVDTCVCIYYLDRHSEHHDLARHLFLLAARGDISIEIAGITYSELLVGPFRSGDRRAIEVVLSLAHQQQGVELAPVTEIMLLAGAMIRAVTRMKTPDALIAASAALRGCGAVITNDSDFAGVRSVPSITLPMAKARVVPLPAFVSVGDYSENR